MEPPNSPIPRFWSFRQSFLVSFFRLSLPAALFRGLRAYQIIYTYPSPRGGVRGRSPHRSN